MSMDHMYYTSMPSAVRRRSLRFPSTETLLRPLTAMAMIVGIALIPLAAAPPASAACTSSTSTATVAGSTYEVTAFTGTGSCTWTVPSGVTSVDVLAVAGGGGGSGGGGGAGGMRSSSGLVTIPGATVSVTVGAGGAGTGGDNSEGVGGLCAAFSSDEFLCDAAAAEASAVGGDVVCGRVAG